MLTLDNLVARRCNNLPTATCIMCHSNIESVDLLFIHCNVVRKLWGFFCSLLSSSGPPDLMCCVVLEI